MIGIPIFQIFHVDVWGSDNKRLNENQIVEALQKVMDQSSEATSDCVGVLTSENRDNWAKAYQLLSKG